MALFTYLSLSKTRPKETEISATGKNNNQIS